MLENSLGAVITNYVCDKLLRVHIYSLDICTDSYEFILVYLNLPKNFDLAVLPTNFEFFELLQMYYTN